MRALRAAVLALGVVFGFMATQPCLADDAPADAPLAVAPGARDAIQQVIRDQMAAFGRDDATAAFGFAAPNIQGMFGHDPEQFLSMVRNSYQPVYRPRSTQFGVAETVQGQIVQHVEVEGPDGVTHTALYMMEQEPDGSWRIAGCVLTDSSSVGA